MAPPDVDPRLAEEGAGFVAPGTPPGAKPAPAPAATTDGGSFAPPPIPSEQDQEPRA